MANDRPIGKAKLVASLMISVLVIWAIANTTAACLVCYRPPYQSLLEKVELSDHVIVAHTLAETRSAWQGRVVRVIKGDLVAVNQVVTVNKSKSDRMTLGDRQLLRRSSLLGSWTIEGPVDRKLLGFLAGALEISSRRSAKVNDQSQYLRYMLPHLENANPQIADSAHSKIARAPYVALRSLGKHIEPDRLVAWIRNPQIAPKRGSLYITLLGVCGAKREQSLIKQWIDEGWESQTIDHLAAMLTAHAELSGEETIRFIERSYIQNRDRELGELIAAVKALRVHGQADGKIPRSRIKASFQLLLRHRPALLELIVEDSARWKDWSIAPKLMEVYASGKQPWNNAMIIKYLQSCPLPSAKQFVARLSALDRQPAGNAKASQQPKR